LKKAAAIPLALDNEQFISKNIDLLAEK